MDVVVLAGAKCQPDLREATGAEFRCDITVGGRTLLDTALASCEGLGPTVVVGPRAPQGATLARPGESLLQSMGNGLAACQGDSVLFVTADLPYIESRHVRDFLGSIPQGAGLAYSVVPVDACYARFPGQKRTSLKVREGRLTGGNLIYAKREVVNSLIGLMQAAYDARKSPLRLAALVGPGVALRALLGQVLPATLPLACLEAAMTRKVGAMARAVVSQHPEVATDLDSLEQYVAATA